MFSIDLGLRLGSVMLVVKGKPVDWLVIKDDGEHKGHERARILAKRYLDTVVKLASKHESTNNVSIEEPLFSWGRKNPKAFATSLGLFVRVVDLLEKEGFRVKEINAKSAKMAAGSGDFKKDEMVRAYTMKIGCAPGSKTNKGQETLADAYFIAMAGLKK